MHWWQIDPSAYIIGTLEKFGLIRNVVRIAPERLAKRRLAADVQEERDVLPGVVLETGTAAALMAGTVAEAVSQAAAQQPPL
jgi:hypothetical protein